MKILSIVRGVQEITDLHLKLEGEDPVTGLVPVYQYRVDKTLKFDNKPPAATTLKSWVDVGGHLPVSKVPCEILYRIFREEFGSDWFELEHEVLCEHATQVGLVLDEGGLNKLIALKILFEAPPEKHPFYTSLKGYQFLARALMGQEGQFDDGTLPSAKTLAVANYVAFELVPLPFSYEVLAYIAAVCLARGVWCLPHALEPAQEVLLRIAAERDLGIDAERVDKVRGLMRKEELDDTYIDDDPDDEDEQQALVALDLKKRVQEAIAKADALNDAFTESVG